MVRHRNKVKADIDDLKECERSSEPQIALHVANKVPSRQTAVRSQGSGTSVGLDRRFVLLLMLERDAEVIPGGRVVGGDGEKGPQLLLGFAPAPMGQGNRGPGAVSDDPFVEGHR